MNREELIEKAAKAILARSWGLGTLEGARGDAEAALAVFERAHTPTDGERADALRVDPEVQRFADRLFEVGLRSPESTKALLVFKEFRRTVQGEP